MVRHSMGGLSPRCQSCVASPQSQGEQNVTPEWMYEPSAARRTATSAMGSPTSLNSRDRQTAPPSSWRTWRVAACKGRDASDCRPFSASLCTPGLGQVSGRRAASQAQARRNPRCRRTCDRWGRSIDGASPPRGRGPSAPRPSPRAARTARAARPARPAVHLHAWHRSVPRRGRPRRPPQRGPQLRQRPPGARNAPCAHAPGTDRSSDASAGSRVP